MVKKEVKVQVTTCDICKKDFDVDDELETCTKCNKDICTKCTVEITVTTTQSEETIPFCTDCFNTLLRDNLKRLPSTRSLT